MMWRSATSLRGSGQPVRRAVITVLVLVVLLLITALLAEFVRRAVSDRRQMRREYLRQQAVYLADAGVERMLRQRSETEEYSGEVWKLASGEIHQTNTAEVTISIDGEVATVTARYPANDASPIQVTRTIRLVE